MNSKPDSSASEDLGADFAKALAQGWLPIREVARQTGVNAVTLRAWERRYGLVVPHRTPKGHRLFSPEHVQRIQSILTWINRGVAVSKIKPLLDTPQPPGEPLEDDWQRQRHALVLAVSQLAERQIDDLVNQAMALYPPWTVCEQLLLPLLAELQMRWQGQFGAQMEQVFFIPGCAANSAAGSITTTASCMGRRCCWSITRNRRSLTCGSSPGSPAMPIVRWKYSMVPCLRASWPWPPSV